MKCLKWEHYGHVNNDVSYQLFPVKLNFFENYSSQNDELFLC